LIYGGPFFFKKEGPFFCQIKQDIPVFTGLLGKAFLVNMKDN